jgi:poly(hydroxyalkanoate) depolymerase family esterase
MKYFFSVAFIFSYSILLSQGLKHVKHFGTRKGHLKMYYYEPLSIEKNKPRPMVVVLHGCLQCAETVAEQTGWNKLADDYGFYILYPQQRTINNVEKCFKWYKRRQNNKNKGENYSIKMMIDYMKKNYQIDSSNVFITGLSAGAAMSVIMMADYPEIFNAGAIFAGCAYKSGNGIVAGMLTGLGWRIKSAQKWGNIVRKQNPNYTGEYPRMIIYQGNSDWIVNKRNGGELMKQWTNLHLTGTQPSETINRFVNIGDIQRNVYKNDANKDVVIFYKINNLSHALLVNPGNCKYEGGKMGLFSKDINFHSTLWTAYDFGLIQTPAISGKKTVTKGEKNIIFSVPYHNKSTYEWTYPNDATVEKNENTNSIELDWGNLPGNIDVTETDSLFCKKQYKTIFVNVIP